MTRWHSTAKEAADTIASRLDAYGPPEKCLEHAAKIASAILQKEISLQDLCWIMKAVKAARERNSHGRDNLVDDIAYTLIIEAETPQANRDKRSPFADHNPPLGADKNQGDPGDYPL